LRASLLGARVRAEETTEASLVLPPSAIAFGRALGPEGSDFSGLAVELVYGDTVGRLHDALSGGTGVDSQVRTAIDPDGSFRFDALPPGLYRPRVIVEAHSPDPFGGAKRPPSEGENGWIRLHPGANDLGTLDAGPSVPGWVEVDVTAQGVPASGARVTAFPFHAPWSRGGRTDARGRIRIGPLQPGVYAFLVQIGSEFAVLPDLLGLEPGEEARVAFDLRRFPGSLQVRSAASGEPLANEAIWLTPAFPDMTDDQRARFGEGIYVPSTRSRVYAVTDDLGTAHLVLAEGAYWVLRPVREAAFVLGTGEWADTSPRIRWTPGGPVPAAIDLMPRGEAEVHRR